MTQRNTPERVWAKVDRNGPVPDYAPHLGPCWIWTAYRNSKGYGRLKYQDRMVLAHVWAWEQTNGAVPGGLELDHLCRVPACCNPSHLEPVTHLENMRRAIPWGALATHCVNGHEFTPENTRVWKKKGWRSCKACANAQGRARRGYVRPPQPTHCKRGHLWDEANTALDSKGYRVCRACIRLLQNERYKLRKRKASS